MTRLTQDQLVQNNPASNDLFIPAKNFPFGNLALNSDHQIIIDNMSYPSVLAYLQTKPESERIAAVPRAIAAKIEQHEDVKQLLFYFGGWQIKLKDWNADSQTPLQEAVTAAYREQHQNIGGSNLFFSPALLEFPSIHPFDPCYRMGGTEEYVMSLNQWIESLPDVVRVEYDNYFAPMLQLKLTEWHIQDEGIADFIEEYIRRELYSEEYLEELKRYIGEDFIQSNTTSECYQEHKLEMENISHNEFLSKVYEKYEALQVLGELLSDFKFEFQWIELDYRKNKDNEFLQGKYEQANHFIHMLKDVISKKEEEKVIAFHRDFGTEPTTTRSVRVISDIDIDFDLDDEDLFDDTVEENDFHVDSESHADLVFEEDLEEEDLKEKL